MKVAFTSDVYWPRINGVTVSTNIFLNELTKLGHQVHLWAPEYPVPEGQKNLYHNDPRVTRLKSFGLFFSKEDRLPAPRQKKKFFQALDAFAPELLHVQTEFTLSLMARKYARRRGLPAYVVAFDRTLQELASRRPVDLRGLESVHGLGPARIDAYGKAILSVLHAQ